MGSGLKRAAGGVVAMIIVASLAVGVLRYTERRMQEIASRRDGARKWALWASGCTQLRGANIYQRRVYGRLGDAETLGDGVTGPPYHAGDLDALAAAGANMVVISHPGIFTENPPYVLDERIAQNLDRLVALAADAGLSVVISFRTGPGRSEFSILRGGAGDWFPAEMINDAVWYDSAAQEGWCEMWRAATRRYGDHPAVVGFELMMEPNGTSVLMEGGASTIDQFFTHHGGGLGDWNEIYPRLVSAVRDVSKQIPLLVPAEGYGSIYWLTSLKPIVDPRCVYVVHHYVPSAYTHQSSGLGGAVHYPGYIGTEHVDERWLGRVNKRLSDYAAVHGVPVAVLEAGVRRWAPGAARFMANQLEDFETLGVNWALWLWECGYTNYSCRTSSFNFRAGPAPEHWEDLDTNALFLTIQRYWQRNAVSDIFPAP